MLPEVQGVLVSRVWVILTQKIRYFTWNSVAAGAVQTPIFTFDSVPVFLLYFAA